MTPEELKREIDGMTQYQLCQTWRFATVGNPLLQGEVGEYFAAKLDKKGGFTPEISRALGWKR